MSKKFLYQIFLLVSINFLVKPFYLFGIERKIQNILPDGDFGLYFALFNFTFILQIFADLGLQYYNTTHLAGNPRSLNHHLSHIIHAKLILSLLFIALVGIGSLALNYSTNIYPFLILIAINQLLNSFTLYFRSNLSALGYYTTDSMISVLDKILLIIFLGVLLFHPEWKKEITLFTLVLSQTAAGVLTAFTSFFLNIYFFQPQWIQPQWSSLKSYFKNSLPYAWIVFLMLAYTRTDAIMLERILENGTVAADIYAAAYRILDASNTIGLLFASLLLPMFSTLINQNQKVDSLLNAGLSHLWWISVTLCFTLIPFSNEIMDFLYPGISNSGAITLQFLLLSFLPLSAGYIYGPILTAGKIIFKMNLLYGIGVLMNIALNVLLIPQMAEKGAALATFITQTFIALSQIYMCYKHIKPENHFKIWFRLIGFILIMASITLLNVSFLLHCLILWMGALILGHFLGIFQPLRFFSNFTIKNQWSKEKVL